ncbi:hypothetical protein STCU_03601 [Strigomonas culicis]|uniref:Nodulin-like domain-containing protein n=1 Tax=Strigomonas culicis TaxID=28005 RepID=S9UQL6_9TRYP|nr:hypothetical protein STCU_03601 [Strigomonas culicis]|eukprot:EPY31143.1 hypothetical protein STCU_03601 [Strigomonas culicis]
MSCCSASLVSSPCLSTYETNMTVAAQRPPYLLVRTARCIDLLTHASKQAPLTPSPASLHSHRLQLLPTPSTEFSLSSLFPHIRLPLSSIFSLFLPFYTHIPSPLRSPLTTPGQAHTRMKSNTIAQIETLDLTNQKRINEVHRFSLLVLGAMCCICTSFCYAFNLISGDMQTKYNLTQRDLSTISCLGMVFTYFAIPYAFIFDYLGPIPVAAIAIVCLPVGSICLALTFMNVIEGSVAKLAVFNGMMGGGSIQFDLVAMMPIMSYFPTRKGYVTVLLKTFSGLGQALVGTIFIGFFSSKADRHLFFLAAFAVVTGVLSMLFLRLPPYHLTGYEMSHLPAEEKAARERTKAQYLAQKPPMWRFMWGFCCIVFFIIYLPVQSVIIAFIHVSHTTEIIFAIVASVVFGLFACLCLPWTACCGTSRPDSSDDDTRNTVKGGDIVGNAEFEDMHAEVAQIEESTMGKHEPLSGDKNMTSELNHSDAEVCEKMPVVTDLDYIAPQYSTTFIQNLLSTELWSVFWSLFVAVGAQLVVIFNAAYILGALQGEKVTSEVRTLLTVINGTGSAIGRASMSFFEIYTQNRKAEDRIPITVALFFPTSASFFALVLFLALPGNLSLLLPFMIIALGNGFVNAAVVLTARTIYAKESAKHYHFYFLAMACSSIVFVRGLYGEWYSSQAEKNGSSLVCYGRDCVQVPLIILTCLSATGFATTVYAHFRYRAFSIRTLRARAQMREGEKFGAPQESNEEVPVYSAEPIRTDGEHTHPLK